MKTISLSFPGGPREVPLVARAGRWAVTRSVAKGSPMADPAWLVSETRTGLRLDAFDRKAKAVAAMKRLDLVCPDWLDRERWQSGEMTREEWEKAGSSTVSRILYTASRGMAGAPAGYVESCVEVCLGTKACPPGICLEGLRRLLTDMGVEA